MRWLVILSNVVGLLNNLAALVLRPFQIEFVLSVLLTGGLLVYLLRPTTRAVFRGWPPF